MCQISSSKSLIYQHRTDSGHQVGFTSTAAGNMSMTVLDQFKTVDDTIRNRRELEDQLGISPGTTRFVSQTHSTTILEAGELGWAAQDTVGEGDALISPDGSDPIAILVADCLPIAFITDFGPTAIVHAGRVGLLNGILQDTVQRLRTYDDQGTGLIQAFIGPGICGRCYEVPTTMREDAVAQHPEIYSVTSWGTPALDLPAAAESILHAAQVNVHRVAECTYTNESLFSHRRRPGAGRIAGFVWKP